MSSDFQNVVTSRELGNFLFEHASRIPANHSTEMLTILVTSFRRPERLKKCLNSVSDTGFKEIIVSASGLRPADLSTLREMGRKHPFLRITALSADLGCNENWLRGLYLVSTPYVLILHDDDQLAPEFLSEYRSVIEPQLREGISHVLWEGRIEENGVLTKEIHRQLSLPTGIYPSASQISRLLELDGYAISPVIQIFNRNLALETLKICERDFMGKTYHTRPKMMVGNDLLLSLRHFQTFDKFLYVAKPLSYFGRWEGSESETHRRTSNKKLLDCYNATREYFLNHSRIRGSCHSKILHVTNPYPIADPPSRRRHSLAEETWQTLAERGDWIPIPLSTDTLSRETQPFPETISVPFIKDVLDAAASLATDEDVLVYTNADTCIANNATQRILQALQQRETGFSFRRDFQYELNQALPNEEVCSGEWYMGADLFAMTPRWWRQHRNSFPDLLIGRPGWDWALRIMMGLTFAGDKTLEGELTQHSGLIEIPNLIYHEKHAPWNELPENRNHFSNRHNQKLVFEFIHQHRPYSTWTPLMKKQFPSTKEFRRGRLGLIRHTYHQTRSTYRYFIRPTLARKAPKILQMSDRITAPLHHWLN